SLFLFVLVLFRLFQEGLLHEGLLYLLRSRFSRGGVGSGGLVKGGNGGLLGFLLGGRGLRQRRFAFGSLLPLGLLGGGFLLLLALSLDLLQLGQFIGVLVGEGGVTVWVIHTAPGIGTQPFPAGRSDTLVQFPLHLDAAALLGGLLLGFGLGFPFL